MQTILCVDNDRFLSDLVRYGFEHENYSVIQAYTGWDALQRLKTHAVDLVLLEINLPDVDGIRVLTIVRRTSQVPVIMLTARSLDDDVVRCFAHGADDYVTKPFNLQVLLARVGAKLRLVAREAERKVVYPRTYHMAGYTFDPASNEVTNGRTSMSLTSKEGQILRLLFLHEGQIIATDRIIDHVWGYDQPTSRNVVKTHINNLRTKLATLPGNPQPILTMPGTGYAATQSDDEGHPLSSIAQSRWNVRMPKDRADCL